jgi:hypothetical protein
VANAKGKASENTEETPEETPEEEEAPEESEEESDDSGEEPPSDEKEEEGEAVEEYFDLSKLPDGLKAVGKKMQSTHTRKMQALALDSRKAAALDDLLENSDFKLFLADLESGNPYGASARKTAAAKNSEEEDEDTPGLSEGKLDMNRIVKAITPVIHAVVQQSIAPMVNERAQSTWERVRESHSDFDDYLPDITKIQKAYPNMPLERAYRLAKVEAGDGEPTPRKATKGEVKKAASAKTLGAGAAKGGIQGVAPKTAATLREALKGALAEQGIKV